jgi:hypothetical protein
LRLPIGADRNDLCQLAVGLLWLHRKGKDTSLRPSASISHSMVFLNAC